MSWLSPWGLLGLLSVPVLVALSLWRRRRREVAVSSLLLWRQVAAAQRAAPPTQRRRRVDPLIALRLAVALVLTGAMCGLLWLRRGAPTRRLTVVVDRSASMAMRRPDGRSRWQACLDELRPLLGRLGPRDQLVPVLVPAYRGAASGAEPDAVGLAKELGAVAPSDVAVREQELVEAVRQAAPTATDALVVVATDDRLEGLPAWARPLATGGAAANRGIVAFAARRRRDGTHEVLVGVAATPPARGEVEVVLRGDGRELGRRQVAVAAGGRGQAVLEAALGDVDVLEAHLVGDDALAADNHAWLARRTRRVRAAWVGDASPALRRALAVQEGVDVVEAAADALPADCDLVVYYGTAPTRLPARGTVAVVAPRGPVGGLRPAGQVEAGVAMVVAPRDPLMAAVRLEGVRIGRVARVTVPENFDTLARAGDVPLIGRWRQGRATVVYVGIEPSRGGWALSASFPIFWANVVDVAAGGGRRGELACVRPGEPCGVGPVGEPVEIDGPDGRRLEVAGGVLLPQRVGLYRVRPKGTAARAVAVSLLSEAETTAQGCEARLPRDPWEQATRRPLATGLVRVSGALAALGLLLVVLHGWRARAAGFDLREARASVE